MCPTEHRRRGSATPLLNAEPSNEFLVDDINKPLEHTDKDKSNLVSYLLKCDCRLLLYICIGYATDSLNKMALSNAKVAGLTKDLDLHGYDINIALGVYYLGSFFFQLPSNMVLKKVRPTYWLSASMFAWSLVTMSTAFVKSAHQLALCRFLFGAVQSGYLTGSLYYISYWYPRDEVRKRMGFFFASSGIGGVIVGPLCSVLSGVEFAHFKAWQSIFFFIGLISFTWSLLGPFVLQDYPDKATFITEDERQLITRIMVHQNTIVSNQKISIKQIKMTLKDYKIWLYTLIDFCANGATQVNGMFGPTIIASQGFSPRMAQALTALTNFMAFSGMASIAYIARLARGSSHAIMISNAITITGFLLALFSPSNAGRMVALFLFSFASPQPAAHSPAWELANQQGSTKPAMAAAFTSAFGGLGPLVTSFSFRDKDKPKFVFGHTVCLSMTVVCLMSAVLLRYILTRENQRRDANPQDISHLSPEEVLDLADNHPDFRYKI